MSELYKLFHDASVAPRYLEALLARNSGESDSENVFEEVGWRW